MFTRRDARLSAAVRRFVAVLIALVAFAHPLPAYALTGTRVTTTASASSATIHRAVTITATFRTLSGKPIPKRSLRFERFEDASWRYVKTITTNSRGQAATIVRPPNDTKYRYRYLGSSTYAKTTSATRTVKGYKAPSLAWNGVGTQLVGPFTLEQGLTIFNCIPGPTDSNFIVWLADSAGKDMALLANEIGSFATIDAEHIPENGSYYLKVKSDTPWRIVADQPRQLTAPATRSFSGDGRPDSFGTTELTGMFALSKKTYKVSWQSSGTRFFYVWLRDQDGRPIELISSESGPSTGSTAVSVSVSGLYFLDIQTDLPWTMTWSDLDATSSP